MELFVDQLHSPIGLLRLAWEPDALRALEFENYEDRLHQLLRGHYHAYTLLPRVAPAFIREPIEAYFEGDLRAIEASP
ncbi:MAG: hypothetical protein WKF37_03735 [Bryobacteraceae bacterium]